MTDAELMQRAVTAIQKAFKNDIRGFDALREHIADLDEDALTRLYAASEALGDAALDLMAREH
jgi:hypothetical protein